MTGLVLHGYIPLRRFSIIQVDPKFQISLNSQKNTTHIVNYTDLALFYVPATSGAPAQLLLQGLGMVCNVLANKSSNEVVAMIIALLHAEHHRNSIASACFNKVVRVKLLL